MFNWQNKQQPHIIILVSKKKS